MLSTLVNSKLDRITYAENFQLFTDEQDITADAIVIATGQRFKRYETIESIAGSQQLRSSNHVCFNPGIIPMNYGQTVAIVGGGDNGLGTAIMLADRAKHIHLFVRSRLRGFGMNQQKVLEYVKAGKITLHKPVNIHQFHLLENQIQIAFQEENNSEQELLVDRIFFRMGFLPNIEEILQLFEEGGIGSLELDSGGYIATDRFLRTSIPNVYAAGDVTNPRDPCVATAVAHGAVVARTVEEDLRYDI